MIVCDTRVKTHAVRLFRPLPQATFPIMAKVNVNGDDAAPLWKWLKHEKPGLLGIEVRLLLLPEITRTVRFVPSLHPH